jgi:hypothetical protein
MAVPPILDLKGNPACITYQCIITYVHQEVN